MTWLVGRPACRLPSRPFCWCSPKLPRGHCPMKLNVFDAARCISPMLMLKSHIINSRPYHIMACPCRGSHVQV